jgi:phosphonoacetate hydrolase
MMELCGRRYALPRRKTVLFCVDGCAPEYLDFALADGLMPRLRRTLDEGGHYGRGRGQVPTFTNPNNLSIVTGAPPREHGISGNYYFDEARGEEVPMNDPRFLRAPTIFERFEDASVRTLCVTAKDKLRALLGARRTPGRAPVSLSAEKAREQSVPEIGVTDIGALIGRAPPSIYDPDISHYAMEMGLALHERLGASFVYVSLTDYVQHKDAPRGEVANRFYARFDELLGHYLDQGFLCGFTADHGMNAKTRPDGSPDVRFLSDVLESAGITGARVLLPITDPYVVHHGALGSYATVYVDREQRGRARETIAGLDGVEFVLSREEAAERFALPPDRIGDLVVLSGRSTVLGKRAAEHDLSAVERGLRSHGGLHEQEVPIVVCHPLQTDYRERLAKGALSNSDLCDLMLNGIAM